MAAMAEGIVPVLQASVEAYTDDEEVIAACAKSESIYDETKDVSCDKYTSLQFSLALLPHFWMSLTRKPFLI